jgi:hypothetical protein
MPKESNYFEEAYRLCQDDDRLVSRTCKSLYNTMLQSKLDNSLSPLGNFNILYFFQSTIQALLKQFPGVTLAPSAFPCHADPISGCNWPDELQAQELSIQGESSLISNYIKIIASDSTPPGDKFDVNYACKIIVATFNKKDGIIAAWRGLTWDVLEEKNTVDFDYWLAGFNSDMRADPKKGGPEKGDITNKPDAG